ncbi:unnamed protein product [Prunus armeniaca]|uniref:Uncharacterized protein n=1 Tax=Prunus armeniaca TaxID=36596 RepID=A0A6J5VL33_PRUAR|nr:unnamed protein product [Prunus armeniaca]CAB4320234.1 unnamed protein product [Prunus armeniaca]
MSLQQEHKSSIDLVFCRIYGYNMIWFSAESQFNSVSPTGVDGVLGVLGNVGFGIGESTGFGFLGVCSNSGMVIGLLIFLKVKQIVGFTFSDSKENGSALVDLSRAAAIEALHAF